MTNTVEYAVRCMCFLPYTHIIVRSRGADGIEIMGGGRMRDIISRYGTLEIERSFVSGDTLFIDVKSEKTIR